MYVCIHIFIIISKYPNIIICIYVFTSSCSVFCLIGVGLNAEPFFCTLFHQFPLCFCSSNCSCTCMFLPIFFLPGLLTSVLQKTTSLYTPSPHPSHFSQCAVVPNRLGTLLLAWSLRCALLCPRRLDCPVRPQCNNAVTVTFCGWSDNLEWTSLSRLPCGACSQFHHQLKTAVSAWHGSETPLNIDLKKRYINFYWFSQFLTLLLLASILNSSFFYSYF